MYIRFIQIYTFELYIHDMESIASMALPFIMFLSAQEINNGVSQIPFIVQIQFKNFSCCIKFIFAQIICRKCNFQLFATTVLRKARTIAP